MLNDNFVTFEIGKAKHIALVAHDGKKKELIEWCDKNKDCLLYTSVDIANKLNEFQNQEIIWMPDNTLQKNQIKIILEK